MAKRKTVKKGSKAKAAPAKAKPQPKGPALLARAKTVLERIAKQLPKGAEITTRSARATLRHPLLPKGIVASCFARQNHETVLLPALGGMLKVKDTDRAGNPFVQVSTGKEADELGKRIAKVLKK